MAKEKTMDTKKETAEQPVQASSAEQSMPSAPEASAAPESTEAEAAVIDQPVIVVEKSEEEFVRRAQLRVQEAVSRWKPKTRLGIEVKEGKVTDIDAVLASGKKILEAEVIDKLIEVQTDLIAIGQSKGKFGGGKRRAWRQTQRKTAEGNVPTFACMVVAGDANGHIGLGYGKAKETLPAREKATREAKLSLALIKRGCGSFDCSCTEPHSIPFRVEGKCGSAKIILLPAPRGTGLVVEKECKKILAFAGVKDVYSQTFGQTRTKINLAKACFEALKNTTSFVK